LSTRAGRFIGGDGQIGSAHESAVFVDPLDDLDFGRRVIDLNDV
jgi:hypothetical protein